MTIRVIGINLQYPAFAVTVSNNLVYGNATGIYVYQGASTAPADQDLLSNNTVRNNVSVGISAHSYVILSGNTVYGQAANGADGIDVDGGVEVANNVIYGNYNGIVSNGANIHNNRLYNNSNVAIFVYGSSPVVSNDIYSNNIGIQTSSVFYGAIEDNLIYANTTYGILLQDSYPYNPVIEVVNNTIYQVVGTAVRLDSGARNNALINNILWVQAGYDIYVADDSQTNFTSDDNLLHTGTDPNAHVGFWNSSVNGGIRNALSDWQTITGQDAHSLNSDPKFVNIVGADDLLGYTQVNGSYADYGKDDNFTLSAGSPAIDVGNSWSAPLTDIQGFPRQDDPGTPNQGSLEYFPAAASPQPAFPSGGTAQNRRSANYYFNYTLPFAFTFYGQTYASVYVSTNGYLQFAGLDYPGDGTNPSAKLLRDPRIAPLWANLATNQPGDDIYVDIVHRQSGDFPLGGHQHDGQQPGELRRYPVQQRQHPILLRRRQHESCAYRRHLGGQRRRLPVAHGLLGPGQSDQCRLGSLHLEARHRRSGRL